MQGRWRRWYGAVLLMWVACHVFDVAGNTDSNDAAALAILKSDLQNTPTSWHNSDPCGAPWDGITCDNGRVITLSLASMGLQGSIPDDIGTLTQLRSLVLSNNPGLMGPIPTSIGNLVNLRNLILLGCSFTGSIPSTIANLAQLVYFDVNSNKLTGNIPPSLGKLSNLYWLDISNNTITGSLPVSSGNSYGLDNLNNARHFHFSKNQLSGSIPNQLFSSKMVLIHILFDGNNFTGEIPSTIGAVQTLKVLRLDRNSLNGSVPSSLNNLTVMSELNLADNGLSGLLPNFTGLSSLNSLDLSNNSFDPFVTPTWLSNLQSLSNIVMENTKLQGQIPTNLFNLPSLQIVKLKNNALNGSFDINPSSPLLFVDLENNRISSLTIGSTISYTLSLSGNPVCIGNLASTRYCQLPSQGSASYSTNITSCGQVTCSQGEKISPQSCKCAYPFEGILIFRAPTFRDLSNSTRFKLLELQLWTQLNLVPHSLLLSNLFFDVNDYLSILVDLLPSDGIYFNQSEVIRISTYLTNQNFTPPTGFGPYYFLSFPYIQGGSRVKSTLSSGVLIGIAVASAVLVVLLALAAFHVIKYKKRAREAALLTNPFESWVTGSGSDDGRAPQPKRVQWFSFDDMKKYTDDFSKSNEIGSGGYGKVYKGILPDGRIVAVKRAEKGSTQGALEFKTEIELLSRVHHKNLVNLVGFCYDKVERMLVYEFMCNGTLRESLTGQNGVYLDWRRRLDIALGSARGLTYLHELVDPRIIHRDVKSPNILLDVDLTAKVADFGLSKLVSDTEKSHVSTQVKGTLGYLDPEYYTTQQLTDKSDVYSFGVVMLELITGRLPIEKGTYIVRQLNMAMDTTKELYGLEKLLDPIIVKETDLIGFKAFVDLAMQCVGEHAAGRPSMNMVVKELESILQSGRVIAYGSPSSSSNSGMSKNNIRQSYGNPYSGKEISSDEFTSSGGYA